MVAADPVASVDIRDELGAMLMIRSSVPPLFRKISRIRASRVLLDFSRVEFMSRSFADEYLQAKAASKKRIDERHLPEEAARMLSIVAGQRLAARPRSAVPRQRYPHPQVVTERGLEELT